jgi:hypothetical protein
MSSFNFQEQYEEAMRKTGIEVSYYPTRKPGLPGRYEDYKRAIQHRSPAYISQLPQEKIDTFEKELHELIVAAYEKVLQEEEQAFYRRRFDERMDAEVRQIQAIRKEVEEKRKQKKKELQAAIEAIDEFFVKNEGFQWFVRQIQSGEGRYTYHTNWGTSYLNPWLPSGEEKFNDLEGLERHVQEFQKKLAEFNTFKNEEASGIVAKYIEQQIANCWNKSDEDILKSMKEAEANGHTHFLWSIHNPFSPEPFESPTLWKQMVLSEVWSKPAQEEMAKYRIYCETLYKRNKDEPLLSDAKACIQELKQQLTAERVRNDQLESKLNVLREVFKTI